MAEASRDRRAAVEPAHNARRRSGAAAARGVPLPPQPARSTRPSPASDHSFPLRPFPASPFPFRPQLPAESGAAYSPHPAALCWPCRPLPLACVSGSRRARHQCECPVCAFWPRLLLRSTPLSERSVRAGRRRVGPSRLRASTCWLAGCAPPRPLRLPPLLILLPLLLVPKRELPVH